MAVYRNIGSLVSLNLVGGLKASILQGLLDPNLHEYLRGPFLFGGMPCSPDGVCLLTRLWCSQTGRHFAPPRLCVLTRACHTTALTDRWPPPGPSLSARRGCINRAGSCYAWHFPNPNIPLPPPMVRHKKKTLFTRGCDNRLAPVVSHQPFIQFSSY